MFIHSVSRNTVILTFIHWVVTKTQFSEVQVRITRNCHYSNYSLIEYLKFVVLRIIQVFEHVKIHRICLCMLATYVKWPVSVGGLHQKTPVFELNRGVYLASNHQFLEGFAAVHVYHF